MVVVVVVVGGRPRLLGAGDCAIARVGIRLTLKTLSPGFPRLGLGFACHQGGLRVWQGSWWSPPPPAHCLPVHHPLQPIGPHLVPPWTLPLYLCQHGLLCGLIPLRRH